MAKKLKPQAAPDAPATTPAQPYYLQRAHIKDFRSIRDAKVDFKPGLNIIIGPNGSGKTNFIKCVDSGINLTSEKFIGGNDSSFQLSGKQEVLVVYKSSIASKSSILGSIFPQEAFIKRSVVVKTSSVTLEGATLIETISGTVENHLKYSGLSPQKVISINHGIPNPYGTASVQINLSIDDEGWGVVTEQNIFLPTSVENARVAIYLNIHEHAERSKLTEKSILTTVRAILDRWLTLLKPYLSRFSPINDIRLSNSVQAYTNSQQREISVQGIQVEFKINGAWLPFNALSSGTQRMFYIICEVMSLTTMELTDLKNELNYDKYIVKTILLEEPELGIHPDQLHKLLQFLREQSEKHQIIITTHSPQVLDMLNEDELDRITICELHKTKGTQFRKLKKAQITTARQFMKEQGVFLSDYWRYGNLEGTN